MLDELLTFYIDCIYVDDVVAIDMSSFAVVHVEAALV